MILTCDFKERVLARAKRDPEFSRSMFEEAINHFLTGDLETGKTILRDYINATISSESSLIEDGVQ